MAKYAELEIGFHRWSQETYAVELRFSQSESEVDVRLVSDGPPLIRLSLEDLLSLENERDDLEYGTYLSTVLFREPSILGGFLQARTSAETLGVPLRIRLYISPSARELQGIRWESVRDPEGRPIATNNNILFSRYVTSADFRPIRPRRGGHLSALLVISNPTNLRTYHLQGQPLAPLDVDRELQRVIEGLGSIRYSVLSGNGKASIESIISSIRLRDPEDIPDILYIVCHGGFFNGQPRLYLEDDMGNVSSISGTELIERFRELPAQPRLVILGSCESAGPDNSAATTDDGAMAALGPRLAEAGVAAVIAMRGKVAIKTVRDFMPVFFRQLDEDGQVDRAVAVARRSVPNEAEARMPVLFSRLRTGRLWYVPGLDSGRRSLNDEKWRSLIDHIQQGRCTPIIGAGVAEAIIGSKSELARRWATTFKYPMMWDDRNDLSQVAQYLATNYDHAFPRYQLDAYLRREVSLRQTAGLKLAGSSDNRSISDIISDLGRNTMSGAHKVLATLPCPIYITTEFHDLLRSTIVATTKRTPSADICRWNHDLEQSPLLDDNDEPLSIYDQEPAYRPTNEGPLIYHLFGHLRRKDSLVLTEDDYFDYLIGMTNNKDLIPPRVRRAMVDTALLFIGFQFNDWSFRILFRSLMAQEGRSARKLYSHVAVQVDPDSGNIVEPELARRYLESYFGNAQIAIFWGSTEAFIDELSARWSARCSQEVGAARRAS